MLSDYTIDIVRFEKVNVRDNPTSEQNFASALQNRLNKLLRQYNVSADVIMDIANSGEKTHPLIRITNEKYGSIGLLVNRNIITVIRLRYGKVTELINKQEQLRQSSASNKSASKWNAAGTAASAVGVGSHFFRDSDPFDPFAGCGTLGCNSILGTYNCLSGLNKSSKARRQRKEAQKIQYDPSELSFEQAWEADIMRIISEL